MERLYPFLPSPYVRPTNPHSNDPLTAFKRNGCYNQDYMNLNIKKAR